MDNKIWWASKTIMGILALVIVQIATRFNLKVPDDAVAQITDALLQIAAAIAALWAIYGRSKASTTLTLTKPKDDQGGGTPPAAGIALLFATAFMLSACQNPGALVPPKPKTPQQAVYLAKGEFTVLQQAAETYNQLPRCSAPNAPKICSDQDVIDVIRKASPRATKAIYFAVSFSFGGACFAISLATVLQPYLR